MMFLVILILPKGDALNRQCKVNLITTRRVGKCGPKAKSGLASRVPKFAIMLDDVWRKAKRDWTHVDGVGKLKIEQDILAFVAIHIDMDLGDDGVTRVQDVSAAQRASDEAV